MGLELGMKPDMRLGMGLRMSDDGNELAMGLGLAIAMGLAMGIGPHSIHQSYD